MTPPARPAACDVYELVTESPADTTGWLRRAWLRLVTLVARGDRRQPGGSLVLSLRERDGGAEVFRHIEEVGDDEDHLLHGIRNDLRHMTATEFKARWVD